MNNEQTQEGIKQGACLKLLSKAVWLSRGGVWAVLRVKANSE